MRLKSYVGEHLTSILDHMKDAKIIGWLLAGEWDSF